MSAGASANSFDVIGPLFRQMRLSVDPGSEDAATFLFRAQALLDSLTVYLV